MRKNSDRGRTLTRTRRAERVAKSARLFLFLMDDRAPALASLKRGAF